MYRRQVTDHVNMNLKHSIFRMSRPLERVTLIPVRSTKDLTDGAEISISKKNGSFNVFPVDSSNAFNIIFFSPGPGMLLLLLVLTPSGIHSFRRFERGAGGNGYSYSAPSPLGNSMISVPHPAQSPTAGSPPLLVPLTSAPVSSASTPAPGSPALSPVGSTPGPSYLPPVSNSPISADQPASPDQSAQPTFSTLNASSSSSSNTGNVQLPSATSTVVSTPGPSYLPPVVDSSTPAQQPATSGQSAQSTIAAAASNVPASVDFGNAPVPVPSSPSAAVSVPPSSSSVNTDNASLPGPAPLSPSASSPVGSTPGPTYLPPLGGSSSVSSASSVPVTVSDSVSPLGGLASAVNPSSSPLVSPVTNSITVPSSDTTAEPGAASNSYLPPNPPVPPKEAYGPPPISAY